jgi:hypothetical protein
VIRDSLFSGRLEVVLSDVSSADLILSSIEILLGREFALSLSMMGTPYQISDVRSSLHRQPSTAILSMNKD